MIDGVVVRNHMPHKPYFRFLRSSHGRGEGGVVSGRQGTLMAQASGSAGGCGDDGMTAIRRPIGGAAGRCFQDTVPVLREWLTYPQNNK